MAYQEKEIEKLYWSIGEVAQQFQVAPSLIRFWETEFEPLHPKKNRKGNRQFTKEDIDILRKIYYLVKERGFTIKAAKEELREQTIFDGHNAKCGICNEPCNGLAGDPSLWPARVGSRHYHWGCVQKAIDYYGTKPS